MLVGSLGMMDGGTPSMVLSVQHFSITIAAGTTSNTATINTVNTAMSSEHLLGPGVSGMASTDASKFEGGLVLTNSTTVTANRNTSDVSAALTLYGCVVAWNPAKIQSVQRGSINMNTTTSGTASLSSITTTNAAIQYNGAITDVTAFAGSSCQGTVEITDATTVTATRGLGTTNLTCYFVVVEFKSGVLNSNTQAGTVTLASASASNTATISSVTTGQSMIFYGGRRSNTAGGNNFASNHPYLVLTNGTTITSTRFAGNSDTQTTAFTAVEFKSDRITSINRSTIALTNVQTSNTATITAVVKGKTLPNWLGQTANGTTYNGNSVNTALELTDTTTITASVNTAAVANTVSYEAIEFN